jgi:hypothetical protein
MTDAIRKIPNDSRHVESAVRIMSNGSRRLENTIRKIPGTFHKMENATRKIPNAGFLVIRNDWDCPEIGFQMNNYHSQTPCGSAAKTLSAMGV